MSNVNIDKSEIEYSERVLSAIKEIISETSGELSAEKSEILKQREYFNDYFRELKQDEVEDLVQQEFRELTNYEETLTLLTNMTRQQKNPYFAGFDFEEDDSEDYEESRFYLGIHAVRDQETGEYLVYDWRAPIASLYYEQEPGYVSYSAPMGDIKGNLVSKRRYVFKKGKLVGVSALKMPSDDELLIDCLSAHSDSRMKTIVETIQAEQHKIIRDFTDGLSILQGCAGSGKSSIALHKIAYIMYAFRKDLENRKIVIISPNEYFTEYISSVLPNLGEDAVTCNIPENVVEEVIANALDFDYLSCIDGRIYMETFEGSKRKMLEKEHAFKCSNRFREIVLAYQKYLERTIFTAADLYTDENFENKIPAEKIQEAFDLLAGTPVFSRVQEIARVVCEANKLNYNTMGEYFCGCINDMFSTFSVSKLYRAMYTDTEFLKEIDGMDLPAYLPEKFMFEDACAIAVLTSFLYGEMFNTDVFYMISDEAQDLTPIFLEVIARRYKGANMMFVGDKNQTVFGTSGEFVEDIRKIIRKRPLRIYDLNTNYRSTKEIMNFTNKIAGNDSTGDIRCIREGEEPAYVCFAGEQGNAEESLRKAAKSISDYIIEKYNQGYEFAAVITADKEDVCLMQDLVKIPYECNVNVKFLPVYLAKGLEFDTVAVFNNTKKPFEKSALYTACTRAMHNLIYAEV